MGDLFHSNAPNKSLDQSGGGVFRIKRGAAKVASIRAARSTLDVRRLLTELDMNRIVPICIVVLLFAVPAIAQKKKTSVKAEYDKFKDVTCARVDLGDLSTFKIRLTRENVSVLMDASYCWSGQKTERPTTIEIRLRSASTNWLSGMRNPMQSVIFLLDDNERLTLSGKYEYVVDRRYGGVSQITMDAALDDILQIAHAKTVEFQISGDSYKLKQKNLSKLKDLAENGSQ